MSNNPKLDEVLRQQVLHSRQIRDLRVALGKVSFGGFLRGGTIIGVPGPGESQAIGAETSWVNAVVDPVDAGTVVVWDAARDVAGSTTVGDQNVVGVVTNQTPVAIGLDARVRHLGYYAAVKTQGAVVVGHFLYHSGTLGRAADAGTLPVPGVFAVALSASGGGAATVNAYLFPVLRVGGDKHGVSFTMGDTVTTIPTGVLLDWEVPFDLHLTGWTLVADAVGSLVLDLWADTYANFPATVADTITGTEKPTLAAAVKNQDLALTSWTTDLSLGEVVRINIDSATTVKRATLGLQFVRR